jgi:hypothetical protein
MATWQGEINSTESTWRAGNSLRPAKKLFEKCLVSHQDVLSIYREGWHSAVPEIGVGGTPTLPKF